MAEGTADNDQGSVDPRDLDLITEELDEGKDPGQLWDEIDAAESGAAADNSDAEAVAGAEAQEAQEAAEEDGEVGGDPWATAPEELRSAYEQLQAENKRLEQSERSQRGRVSTLQRQLNEAGQAKPPKGEVDLDTEEGWKAFEQEYPDVAGPVAKKLRDQEERLARLEDGQKSVVQQRHVDQVEEQTDLLAAEHPDWLEIAATPEFVEWVQGSPRHIQEAAGRNANEIVDADEAADLISRYKAFRSEESGPPGESEEGGTGNALADRRRQQLEAATGSRSTGPGAASGIPNDAEDLQAIWDAFDAQEARQAARA